LRIGKCTFDQMQRRQHHNRIAQASKAINQYSLDLLWIDSWQHLVGGLRVNQMRR
jgi:hypothetical protein